MQALLDRGVSTRRGVMNTHLEGAYMGKGLHRAATSLIRSEVAQRSTLILPLFAQMADADLSFVMSALRDIFAPAARSAKELVSS